MDVWVATVGGTVIHRSPISSLCSILQAYNATLKFIRVGNNELSERSLRAFLSDVDWQQTELVSDEILHSIDIPSAEQHEY